MLKHLSLANLAHGSDKIEITHIIGKLRGKALLGIRRDFRYRVDAFRGHGFNLLVAHAPAGLSARAVPAGVATLSLQSSRVC